MSTDTIERVAEVEFFNVEHPGVSIMIKQDPESLRPGVLNPAFANDKYAHFVCGLFSTSDPEIIEALNSPKFRKKGVRCKSNPEDMAEYGSHTERMSWMEQEIERQVALKVEEEIAKLAHATASPFETSPAQDAESISPED